MHPNRAFFLALAASLGAHAQGAGAPEVVAYCEQVAACSGGGVTTAEECLGEALDLSRIAGVNHELCDALLAGILARYSCRAQLPCAELDSSTACAVEANLVVELTLEGAGTCFSGVPPLNVPLAWSCRAFYYGVADGCDCGCGAIDPDCGEGGCTEPGCFEARCEYCYVDDTDVGCQAPGEGEGEGELLLPDPPAPQPTSSCSATERPISLAALVCFMSIVFLRRRQN
jgi:hypothetical protein